MWRVQREDSEREKKRRERDMNKERKRESEDLLNKTAR